MACVVQGFGVGFNLRSTALYDVLRKGSANDLLSASGKKTFCGMGCSWLFVHVYAFEFSRSSSFGRYGTLNTSKHNRDLYSDSKARQVSNMDEDVTQHEP